MNEIPKKKKSILKRWWFWAIVVVIAVIGVAASQGGEGPSKEAGNSPSMEASEKPAELTFGLSEVAVFPSLKITALDIQSSIGDKFFKPDDGKKFVGVKFQIDNTSDKEQSISSLLMFDVYADDIKCAYSSSANITFGEGTLDGSLAAGKKMVGWYAVETPEDAKVIEFQVKDSWLSMQKARFVLSIN